VSHRFHFRRARPAEAEAITQLVLRSKRHWDYPDAFIEATTPQMTFTAADFERELEHVEVLESDGELLGVIRLIRGTESAVLEDLWIEPSAIGHGYGRCAFERAVTIARGWGKGVMEFEADPHAEAFYLHMGAERVAMSPSVAVPGRSLPVMRYTL
jgi:GNAT superfamily N-acetyltransferase